MRRLLALLFTVLALTTGAALGPPSASAAPADPIGELQPAAADEPTVVDSDGVPLSAEHADVVRAVHAALSAGDLDELEELYAGDDWAAQAALLSCPEVRAEVLRVLRTHPANLGEGYVYPGFSSTGWSSPSDVADGDPLGIGPDTLPEPTTGYAGWQTAFFLDSAPPAVTSGDLQWRGIATLPGSATS